MTVLTRSIEDVVFTAEEVGAAIAESNDSLQREILLSWLKATEQPTYHSWTLQCRAIIDGAGAGIEGLGQHDRNDLSSMLQTLVDHLNEPVVQ